MYMAARLGHEEVMRLFLAAPRVQVDFAAICMAAKHGHAGVLSLMLAAPRVDVGGKVRSFL